MLGVVVTAGFASGAIASQSWQGGVYGAFTALVGMGGIEGSGLQVWAVQSFVGGVVDSLGGGDFGHAFLKAGLSAAFMPQRGQIDNPIARTLTGAIVGGTISRVTGGKFANGAVTGAIQAAMTFGVSAESDQAIYPQYRDSEPVGKWASSSEDRQGFIDEMVRRGRIDNAQGYVYVDDPSRVDTGAYMTTFASGRVEVYPAAFESLDYYSFGSVLYHEHIHALRYAVYRAAGFSFTKRSQSAYMAEAEAYGMMLSNSNPFRGGMNKRFESAMRDNDYYLGSGALSEKNMERFRSGDFNCAKGGC